MTNAQIIFNEQLELMKQGIIKTTGRMIEVVNAEGETVKIQEPEPIHTFAAWKSAGYIVKRGEKAKATFQIWKYAKSKKGDNDEQEPAEQESGAVTITTERKNCYLVKAFFFTFDQVEKLA